MDVWVVGDGREGGCGGLESSWKSATGRSGAELRWGPEHG